MTERALRRWVTPIRNAPHLRRVAVALFIGEHFERASCRRRRRAAGARRHDQADVGDLQPPARHAGRSRDGTAGRRARRARRTSRSSRCRRPGTVDQANCARRRRCGRLPVDAEASVRTLYPCGRHALVSTLDCARALKRSASSTTATMLGARPVCVRWWAFRSERAPLAEVGERARPSATSPPAALRGRSAIVARSALELLDAVAAPRDRRRQHVDSLEGARDPDDPVISRGAAQPAGGAPRAVRAGARPAHPHRDRAAPGWPSPGSCRPSRPSRPDGSR